MNENSVLSAYAAYSLDEDERLNSSSGGVFSLLAKQVLLCKGSVYGVAMTKDCLSADFIRITDVNDLTKLQGSKYFQAHIGKTFQTVKDDLNNGMKVLFSGTACQINGLKKYIGMNASDISLNLYCVDVICHGVPSRALWQNHVKSMEIQNGGKLTGINFRCKENGWINYGIQYIFDNQKRIFQPLDKDPFMLMFLRNYCLRPSCYRCASKKNKMSDLTVADFWGIEDVLPDMNDGKGTSLVIIRTQKGQDFFSSLGNRVKSQQVNYFDSVRKNSSEYKAAMKPQERDTFFEDMNTMPFSDFRTKYATSAPLTIKKKIKKILKKVFVAEMT